MDWLTTCYSLFSPSFFTSAGYPILCKLRVVGERWYKIVQSLALHKQKSYFSLLSCAQGAIFDLWSQNHAGLHQKMSSLFTTDPKAQHFKVVPGRAASMPPENL